MRHWGVKRGRQTQEIGLDKVGTLRALGRVVSIRRPEKKRPCQSSKEREGFPGLGDNIRK